MNVLILLNGDVPERTLFERCVKDSDMLICADGAYDWAVGYGAKVDVLIGDMDSISRDRLLQAKASGCEVITLRPEKDEPDAQCCVEHAIQTGATSITLMGGVSRERPDHSLGNLQLLALAERRGAEAVLVADNADIYAQCGVRTYASRPGGLLSIVPWGDDACVSLVGLKYPLNKRSLQMDTPLCISNEFLSTRATVEVHSGCVLVIVLK